jgi:hypothetical protein
MASALGSPWPPLAIRCCDCTLVQKDEIFTKSDQTLGVFFSHGLAKAPILYGLRATIPGQEWPTAGRLSVHLNNYNDYCYDNHFHDNH